MQEWKSTELVLLFWIIFGVICIHYDFLFGLDLMHFWQRKNILYRELVASDP